MLPQWARAFYEKEVKWVIEVRMLLLKAASCELALRSISGCAVRRPGWFALRIYAAVAP
jgi:hypothetical protein